MNLKVVSFVARYGLAVAITAFASIQVYLWFNPPLDGSLYRNPNTPYEAPESPLIDDLDIPKVTLPPKEISALKPSERDVKKIEKEIGGKLPTGPLLSVREIKELCRGGKLVLTMEPVDVTKPEGAQRVVPTIFPNKVPFFEWTLKREFSVAYGQSFGNFAGSFVHLDLRQELVRTGPVEWFVAGGAFVGQGWSNAYVEGGGRITF